MKKVLPFIAFIALLVPPAASQEYFQQELEYIIRVKLDDKNHELTGDVEIEYLNNAPHSLSVIYMHLWPNAYKNDKTALARQLKENGELNFFFSKEEERGYIDQLDFKVNDLPVKWENHSEHIDICKLILNEPLKSGGKIIITGPFHVKIPEGKFSRLGHIGQQYQITQWYPKPAVYDQDGWHPMPYLGQGEFYSEYGSYDVYITLPKNYVIGATGDLVYGEEEQKWLEDKSEQSSPVKNTGDGFPPSDTETKTLHYYQDNVHDFAWFADKRYRVLKGEVKLPHSGRKVTTWLMYTEKYAPLWENAISYINDAVYYYSLWLGDYPYNHVTAVDGALSAGGGMEYPNITVIGGVNSPFSLETVIMHEVGHNWFYGILGSNERMHPWMDEGLNSFYENRYIETKYPDAKLLGELANSSIGKMLDIQRYKHKSQYELLYLLNAAVNQDQPIEHPAYLYTNLNYGAMVYSKTALAFDYMMAYLGEKKFDTIMRKYFETWKFKHPRPGDLRKIFEEEIGNDLGWFFDDLIGTTQKLDYKICSIKKLAEGNYEFTVNNKGNIKGPLPVHGIKNGKQVGVVWYEGFKGKQKLTFPLAATGIDYFKIDIAQDLPEINRNNNTIRTSGIFRTVEPLRLQFLGSLDNPDKTQLFWLPAIGWNNYNKTMLGLAFYNALLPRKKLEFELMPLFGFGNTGLAGGGRVFYNIFPPGKIFQRLSIGVRAARYAYHDHPLKVNFNKLAPELNIEFKKRKARSPYGNILVYRHIFLIEEYARRNEVALPPDFYIKDTANSSYHDLVYTFRTNRPVNPYSVALGLQLGSNMTKTSLEIHQQVVITRKENIGIRFFMAKMFSSGPVPDAQWLKMAGQRGYEDYLYDHIFPGRTETEGLFSRQFAPVEGAFKAGTKLGQKSDWLASLNVKADIPKVPLLKVFADAGFFNESFYNRKEFVYDAGLCLSLSNSVLDIYVPLIASANIRDEMKDVKFMERIRFTLNLKALDPFTLIRNIRL